MSSLGGFLFGNIDEEGRLDNEDFDEELRANLTTFSERIQDRKLLLEGGYLGEDLIEEFSTESKTQSTANNRTPSTLIVAPLPDAENFEDINELAEAIGNEKGAEGELENAGNMPEIGLIEPLNMVNNTRNEADEDTDTEQLTFDTRQILKFTRLSARPSLLNATGRSYSRYAALRKLRLKRKQLLHGKGAAVSVENQIEAFLGKSGPSSVTPSAASSRLRLSLVNLSGSGATMAPIKTAKRPWHQSARFHDLEKSLQRTRSLYISPSYALPAESQSYSIEIPDNSHFHPLALLEWENDIIWDSEAVSNMTTAVNASKGIYVSLTGPQSATPPSQPPASHSAQSGSSPALQSSNPLASASLSSILSSLSLSSGALGADSATSSATATALLALIRNQQLRSASLSTGSLTTSTTSIRPPALTRSPSSAPAASPAIKLKYPKAPAARVINKEFETGDWADSIIWEVNDGTDPAKLKTHLILPLDDPELIFTPLPVENLSKKLGRAEKLIAKRLKKLQTNSTAITNFSKPILDKFNLSNDKYYESAHGNENDSNASNSNSQRSTKVVQEQASSKTISSRSSVSATFLGLHHSVPALQHSVPALKLSPPSFQTCRTKRELRLWHRPRFSIPPGFSISSWLKVKSPAAIKKTSNPMRITEPSGSLNLSISCNPSGGVIRSAKKLTLKDSSRFVLLEYFEEFPPLLMNPGMGAYIVLYYRKKSPQDTFIPRNTFALVQVLDFTDPSPFMMFGDVPAGCSRYALCNGLFRAPLFPHKQGSSDFIVCRHGDTLHADDILANPSATEAEFYLRPLESAPVLLVGQEFPLVEVPGPHSRRHNLFCRQRLQVAAYRLFNKDLVLPESSHSRRRLKIGRLLTAFPQFSEGSIRKWLKDYAESTRAGKDSGVWLLREDAPQLDEDELRALVTPEAMCQYESMMAEQQRLSDAEIILYDPFNANDLDVLNEESTAADDEESVVNTAKKPANSRRCKELDELNHSAPWNTTANFLGATAGRCTLKLRGPGDPSGRGEAFSFVKAPGEKGTSSAVANSAGSEYRQDISRIWESHISSLSATSPSNTSNNMANIGPNTTTIPDAAKLVISRRFGSDQWITEEITDPLIIRAYLRIRKQATTSTAAEKKLRRGFVAPDSLPTLSASDAAPLSQGGKKQAKFTGNPAANKSAKPKSTKSVHSASSAAAEKNLQIKCGACGQVGHMRTNRICPLFSVTDTANTSTTMPANSSAPPVKLKLKLTATNSSASTTASIHTVSSNESNESIYPSPVLVPVSHRPKGPPIEPLQSNRKRPLRKLTPKQIHAQFLALQSVQVKSKLAALSTILISLVDSLLLLPTTPAFHKPVPRKLYPLYYKMIKSPIDLSSIRSKAVALTYKSSTEFSDDFRLLAANCETFNGIDAPLSDVARDMLTRVQNQLIENDEVKEVDNFLKENIIDPFDGEDHVNIDQGDDVSIMTDQEDIEANYHVVDETNCDNGNSGES